MSPAAPRPLAAAPRILARTPLPLAGCSAVPEIVAFEGLDGGGEHAALVFPGGDDARPLVRLHSACVTGDVFGSLRCDCGAQLREAIARCAAEGGAILYLDQEGRGVGLSRKIAAYQLQQGEELDTFAANRALGLPEDARSYGAAVQMLRLLGLVRVRLLTASPAKLEALRAAGLDVEPEAAGVHLNPHNRAYLAAKARRGHRLGPLGD